MRTVGKIDFCETKLFSEFASKIIRRSVTLSLLFSHPLNLPLIVEMNFKNEEAKVSICPKVRNSLHQFRRNDGSRVEATAGRWSNW